MENIVKYCINKYIEGQVLPEKQQNSFGEVKV